jgi:Uma2 family endonuclease
MNIQPNLRMSKAAFIEWNAAEEQRCELVGGRVVMMPGVSRVHGRIVRRLVIALIGRLNPRQWEVIAEFGLDAGPDTLRYPDIIVDRAGGSDKDRVASEPVLLVEVLSPSTAATDLGDKAAEYLQIPSVAAYIVLSQDEPKAWLWSRTDRTFTPRPEVLVGTEAVIQVASLDLQLPLLEVYADIKTGDPQ